MYILQTVCTVFLNDSRMRSNAAKRRAQLKSSEARGSKRLSASALQRAVAKPQRQGKSHNHSRLIIMLEDNSRKPPWISGRCLAVLEVRAAKHSHKSCSRPYIRPHSVTPATFKISSIQFEFPHIQKSINVGKKGLGKPRRVCAASKNLEEGGIGEGSRKGEVDWSSLSLVNALHVS